MSDPIRVLLVDDDEDEYILLREIFNDLSIEIGSAHYLLEWVNTTETAIQIISEQNFDVILIDYHLGDQNGLELFQKLLSQGISTPAILLTGQGSYDLDLRAMQEGFAEYLVKDQITPLLLERSIRYTIEHKQVQIELERRVEERTHDLKVLNQALQAEIERREQTQQALQISEEKFRVLAESTSAAILIITEGHIRYVNPAVKFILGYTPEELLTLDLEQILHPKYQWIVERSRRQSLAGDLPMRYEIKVITKQQEERWLDVTVGEIEIEGQHAYVVTAFDITERDLAERELKKAKDELEIRVTERTAELVAANSRLQTVLNTLPLAIWIADADGNIIQANRMVSTIWGKEALAATSLNDLSQFRGWRTDTKEPLQLEDWALVRAIFKGETTIGEMIDIKRFDGQMATILTSSAPILDPEGQIVGAVAVSQDITEIRRREEHTQRSAQRSGLISRVQQAIAEAGLDIHKILSATSGEIATSTGNKVFIWLVSDDKDRLGQCVGSDPTQGKVGSPREIFPKDLVESSQILAEQVVHSRSPIQGSFESQTSRRSSKWLFPSRPTKPIGIHAPQILCVPILSRGQSIGALGVVSIGEKPIFLEDDQHFYQELAERTGLAIENARLYASSQQREREMNALFTATSVLIQTVDQPTLLSQILDAVQSAIPSAVGSALYIDEPESGLLEPWVIQEHHDPRIGIVNSRDERNQVANAVRNLEAQIVNRPDDDSTYASMMIAPLVMGDRAFGALTIQGNKPGTFHESDLRLLVSFAATAAAVIQNAILHNELQQLAVTDALTNLLNRRGFYNLSEREVERFQRFNHPLTLLMFDVDDFKQVNDTYGHAVGDRVLVNVAEICQISLRQIDIMGRIGGDEFAVLLPETDLRTAVHIASRMRQHIADLEIPTDTAPVSITISMGIVSANRDSRNIAALLARADEKLYDAKRQGKNQIIYG